MNGFGSELEFKARLLDALESIAASMKNIEHQFGGGDDGGCTIAESLYTVACSLDGDEGRTIGQSLESIDKTGPG